MIVKNKHRVLCLIMALAMCMSLLPLTAFAASANVALVAPDGKYIISQTNYAVVDGVTETQVVLNNQSGDKQVKGVMTTIAPTAEVELKASYSGYYTEGSTAESRAEAAKSLPHDMKATTRQAADFEAATGRNVVVATNADYFNMQTGQARGYLIMEGNVVQTGNGSDQEPYFAVLKDGTYAIRDYGVDHSDVLEAISGPFYLVKDGEITAYAISDNSYLAPRNSIGLKADGTVVLFLADGRAGVSAGMTIYEMAQVMKAQGCVNALFLDGGGSATVANKREGSDVLTIRNTPSDGKERVVSSALLVVSTAEGSGTFDHASLSPNNDVYVANATVAFEAAGVDTAGYPTSVPAGLTWSLADDSFGTIDATTGIFKSNGKCGTVTVNLNNGSTVVGTTSIEVQELDEMYLEADSINLAFNRESDLGLVTKYQERDVYLNDVVLDWTIASNTEGVGADTIGSFNGNIFTSGKAKQTLNATINVSYTKADGSKLEDSIHVEIGKMPQVLVDFEPDANGELDEVAQYDWGRDGKTYMPRTNPLTYFAWDDAADAPGMITKEGPFSFDGIYIDPDPAERDICYYPATNLLEADGYDWMMWHTTPYMPYDSAKAEVVSAANGQVRFGDYAMRIDYDYTNLNPGYKNVNMSFRPTEDIELEGTPSGIGMWVYAPEGTPNFWLWMTIHYYDDTGAMKSTTKHFKTQEGRNVQYNGIYWDGWMYCEADVSDLAQYAVNGPITLSNRSHMLYLTFIPGGSASENGDKIPMGDFAKGSIYIDNIRAVYGDAVDDMVKPEYSSITANGTEIAENNSTVVTSNTVELAAAFADDTNDNATGIATAKTTIYVDGILQELAESTASSAKTSVTLANGTHAVKFVISDGFGNVNTVTRYITVNAENSELGSLFVRGESVVTIGTEYALEMVATKVETMTSMEMDIALGTAFGDPTVSFQEGYTGTSTFENGIVHIEAAPEAAAPAVADAEAADETVIAKITFQVPASLNKGDLMTYEVTSGSFTEGETTLTVSQPKASVGVQALYNITADVMMAGSTGKIYVTNAEGKAPGRVKIFQVNADGTETQIGTTNASGILVTNRFCQNVGEKFTIYAKADDGISFRYSATTSGIGSTEVIPTNVRLNAVKNPATTQSITWFAAPEYTKTAAVVEYVAADAYDSGEYTFTKVNGTSKAYDGFEENQATLINSATLTGLTPGTTYCYRVGDGIDGHWSVVQRFTTAVEEADTSFFVIGDTQLLGNVEADAEAIALLHQLAENVNSNDVDFGLQTGDFIDDAGSLEAWNEILGIFAEDYAGLPMVQVMGNHEYYGNTSGSFGKAIFQIPNEKYYSVEYGNVYIAVINCNANVEEAANWLIEDAKNSDCEWKVATVHQPPYYTNPKGSSAAYNEFLPAAIDEAGIDVVFSGHDHSYARTEPMTGGEVDTEEGAVYFICGDLGEKSRSTEYAPDNNPDFHFAKISQEYDAIYLVVNTNGRSMTVTAHDADGTVIDSYTMVHKTACEKSGSHTAQYDGDADKVICSVCGEDLGAYTGFAADKATGKDMYFIGGEYKTGWILLDTDLYHFGENGLAHKMTINRTEVSCTSAGKVVAICECGETKKQTFGQATGHHFKEVTADDGTISYVCEACGVVSPVNVPFIDAEFDEWYIEGVGYCYEHGIVNGLTAITFGPEVNITREQLATILWRVEGSQTPTEKSPFTDKPSNFAATAVQWIAEVGLMKGYPDGTFAPTANISREELVTVLYRYAQMIGMDTSASGDLSKFVDADDIKDYAKDAVAWTAAEGVVNGFPDGTFGPEKTATRAQVTTIITRMLKADAEAAELSVSEQTETVEEASVGEAPAEEIPAEEDASIEEETTEEAPAEEETVEETPAEETPAEEGVAAEEETTEETPTEEEPVEETPAEEETAEETPAEETNAEEAGLEA